MKVNTIVFFVLCLFSLTAAIAQEKKSTPKPVKKFIIEREIPSAGKLSLQELQGIASQSCTTIANMKENVQWLESFVTDNKVYCVYLAENEEAVVNHAKLAGFPANKINEVKAIIDPATAR